MLPSHLANCIMLNRKEPTIYAQHVYWQIFWSPIFQLSVGPDQIELTLLRIFDRDGDASVSRAEMKGIVENLFHLIAESRREDKSPKEVAKTNLHKKNFFLLDYCEGKILS